MFWRGVAFWRSRLQCFEGAWHFGEAACSVLEGLAVFWRVLAVFSWDACSVLERCGILEEALAVVLKESGTFGGRLLCFGVAWHFGEAACSVLEGCGIF